VHRIRISLLVAVGAAVIGCGDDSASDRSDGSSTSTEQAETGGDGVGASAARTSVNALESAPVYEFARAEMPLLRKRLPGAEPVRRVGRTNRLRWFMAKESPRSFCLIVRSSSTRLVCGGSVEDYTGGMTAAVPGPRHFQQSAIVVPDGYTDRKLVGGSAGKVSRIENNILFVLHDEPVEVLLTGRGQKPLRESLGYTAYVRG
jgi:hypothetical protein